MLHVTRIFTYIHQKFKPKAGKYFNPMEHMGCIYIYICIYIYTPRKQTWQWKIHHQFQIDFLLKMWMFQCHVSFQGCMYIYIYPRGRRFTGNSCPKGVYIYEVGVGLRWGGVGMVTFLELAHMVGATQHHVPCTCTHGRCYASHGMGWGGVGMITFFELAHMVGATQVMGLGWGGVGMITFFELADMVGATQVMGLGWGGVGMITFFELADMVGATQVMGLGWGAWGGDDNVLWTCRHGRCYASHGIGVGWGGLVEMWQWLPSSKDSTFMILKKQRQQKTDTKGLTVRHCNFFSCSNSLRLPVNYDTTSKNTVAHSTFEHLEHHNISKIVILPHKSHVSHKYKCMNDGFLINQHADQKNFVRAEHNSM